MVCECLFPHEKVNSDFQPGGVTGSMKKWPRNLLSYGCPVWLSFGNAQACHAVFFSGADVGRCNLLETLHVDQCVHAFAHIWATNAFSNAGGCVSTWGRIWLQKRTQLGH